MGVAHTASKIHTDNSKEAIMPGRRPMAVTSNHNSRHMDSPTISSKRTAVVTSNQPTEAPRRTEVCLNSQPTEVIRQRRHHSPLQRPRPGKALKQRMAKHTTTMKKQAKLSGTSLLACLKFFGQDDRWVVTFKLTSKKAVLSVE